MNFHPSKCYSVCAVYLPIKKARCPSIYHQAYQGITITETLNWKMHVLNDIVTNKANKTLGFIKRNLHSCPERIKAQTYISLVGPTLEYACASWDPYRKYQIDMIEQFQRWAARFVTRQFTVANTTAQEANSKAMHALQNT